MRKDDFEGRKRGRKKEGKTFEEKQRTNSSFGFFGKGKLEAQPSVIVSDLLKENFDVLCLCLLSRICTKSSFLFCTLSLVASLHFVLGPVVLFGI